MTHDGEVPLVGAANLSPVEEIFPKLKRRFGAWPPLSDLEAMARLVLAVTDGRASIEQVAGSLQANLLLPFLTPHAKAISHQLSTPSARLEPADLIDRSLLAWQGRISRQPDEFDGKSVDDLRRFAPKLMYNTGLNLRRELSRATRRLGHTTDDGEIDQAVYPPPLRSEITEEVRSCRSHLAKHGSPRELEVFELLLQDLDRSEIAAHLGIERNTVDVLVLRIRKRFEGFRPLE